MPVIIQFRRGPAAQWVAVNPILAEGEKGVELVTGLFKIGDGVTRWNSLPYAQRGQKGDKGDKGDTGFDSTVPGPQGEKGDQGDQGDTGERGAIGVPGADGHTPIKGVDFFDGAPGAKGDTGDNGYTPLKNIDYFDGLQGDKGDTGESGRGVWNGDGDPDPGLGIDGDFYIDTLNARIYGPKAFGAWGGYINLIGPAGTNGTNGINGDDGLDGDKGDKGEKGDRGEKGYTVLSGTGVPASWLGDNNDFYINLTVYDLYGPKYDGDWGEGISLIGPQGIQGIRGIQGPGNMNYAGEWTEDLIYYINDVAKSPEDDLFYRCYVEHIASEETLPGVFGNPWADVWELFGGGGTGRGVLERDINGDLQPVVEGRPDAYYEFDINGDIMPRAA